MGTRSKGKKSKYFSHVIKFKYRLACISCSRMKRRYVEAGKVKGVSILICVSCVGRMQKDKSAI